MIPLRDVIPARTTPFVTMSLIAVNAAAFGVELIVLARGEEAFIAFLSTWGLVPAIFSWTTCFTAMFLHASWLHIGGNMLSLWIFGDNVEDRLGHGRFFLFYLATGVAANLAETWAGPDSMVPLVGASGAIAGVMGAYLVLFPQSRILVLIPLPFFFDVIEVPAIFFLAVWFMMQMLGGVGRLADAGQSGGVAFLAHAGGFAAGVLGGLLLRRPQREQADWWSPPR